MKILKDSAILLGNGLNNYVIKNSTQSWKSLLLSLTENSDIKSFLNSNDSGISYPELFDLICFSEGESENRYKNLKPRIVESIKTWKSTVYHKLFVDFCCKNNIPVLTTNYDTNLLTDELLNANKKASKKSGKKKFSPQRTKKEGFTDFYPWFSCYSDHKISDALNEFGIWHIHGFWYYKRSLSIGAFDYNANIQRLRKFLYGKKNSLFESSGNWIGKNSWVDIFFHKNLYIIGLSLDVQETSLRWLLMERERYFQKHPAFRKEAFYVCTESELKKSKEIFFKTLNIKIAKTKNYDEIYSSWNIKNEI